MDPKTLASLDPKLRETYERVMGNSGDVANPFEVVSVNASTPGNKQGTLNPDGLSTAFPAPIESATTPQSPANDANISSSATVPGLDMTSPFAVPAPIDSETIPAQEPFPIAGSNIVDTTSFTLNPMGQKTDAGTIGNSPIDPLTANTPTQIESGPNTTPSTGQTVPAFNTTPTKASSPLLRILYISTAIIFFIIYTFIWLKLFKFPLPF